MCHVACSIPLTPLISTRSGFLPERLTGKYKVSFVYRQPLELIGAGADELDIEVQFYRALKFALAIELAPEYGRPVSPDLYNLAIASLAQAQTFHPEDVNVYFEPGRDD